MTRHTRSPATSLVAAVCVLALVAGGCSTSVTIDNAGAGTNRTTGAAEAGEAPSVEAAATAGHDCDSGLTNAGAAMLASGSSADDRLPTYDLEVDIDPATGRVDGSMIATIPADGDRLHFRAFAGLDSFDANLQVANVLVDGEPQSATVEHSLLTIPTPGKTAQVTVELDFNYTISQLAANENIFGALTGDTLEPDQVGLLGRTETGMQLGHWFPVWMPTGTRTDPDPEGYGDIGAFPASVICATISAPASYRIVTGGASDGLPLRGSGPVTEGAVGLRDFAILVSNDIEMVKGTVDGVEIRVWGPTGDRESLQTVLDYSIASQQALVKAFGPYPWRELDVVSAPLGGGVGGMEWPGMVWVERSLFAGGLPGLGGLSDAFGGLFGDDDVAAILGQGGLALDTTLEWTIAHELGHEWWHALVGNDSIASPAVDEPLAQFAACIAMQRIHPENWRAVCEAQTLDQFAQARALGIADAPADQASDSFDSAIQYAAIVYGKAPGFYLEAADLLGWDQLVGSLRSFVGEYGFTLVSTDALRQHLVTEAGEHGDAIDALWERWFSSALGDEDIEPRQPFGDLDELDELFGQDSPFGSLFDPDNELNLDELFDQDSPFGSLFDPDNELNLDELFGQDSPFGSLFDPDNELNLDELFGEDSPFAQLDPDNELGLRELFEALLGGG